MKRLMTIALLWLSALSAAPAQTPEQLRLMQNMTPAEREAVLEQLQRQGREAGSSEAVQFPTLVMDRSLSLADEDDDRVQRLEPGATVVLELKVDEELLGRERTEFLEALHPRLASLLGSSVYKLDERGVLLVDDFYAIPLAGLDVEQAAIRIGAERDFRGLDVEVHLLPLTPMDVEALERFGYDLFAGAPSTFAPATDIPVPADYVIGPGDTVVVQLFGSQNARYELVVNRDGVLQIPKIGPVTVASLRFENLREEITRRVREQMIGVEVSVTLGELRSIRIFVLGDAHKPGSYTVSGLSTITHALYVSGGITEQGSLRSIQLKRNGRVVQTLDLYRLLLQGDTRGDVILQPGDAVFVPPVGKTASISGDVVRPAIYELRGENTVGDLLELAGGLEPSAVPRAAVLQRMGPATGAQVIDLDLTTNAGLNTRLVDGDWLRIDTALTQIDDAVVLEGHVYRPGAREFRSGMRLTDVLPSSAVLRPNADLHYVLIRRETGADRRLQVFSADLAAAWAGAPDADPTLQRRDEIVVFTIDASRVDRIAPLLQQLSLQARSGAPAPLVRVGGRITAPGEFPLEPGMRISDLLRAGGGLDEAAYTLEAELARYDVINGETRRTSLQSVDLAAILAGDTGADLRLQPHDHLIIKEVPEWQMQEMVEIVGEVRFPGVYILQRGEKLSSVIERAGGLTDLAFADGSVFVREQLKVREQEQIENLASRLEADIVAFSLQALQSENDATQALSIGQSLLEQLRETRATGRLVIDLREILAHRDDPVYDIVLRGGDRLLIPKQTQEVTVLGEVQYATSHIYEPGLARDDYISRSGGLTQRADARRIYVVRANGAVLSGEVSRWFARPGAVEIRPGDTIVVPLDADRMSPLSLWTNVSQIIYQLALAAASANAIGVF